MENRAFTPFSIEEIVELAEAEAADNGTEIISETNYTVQEPFYVFGTVCKNTVWVESTNGRTHFFEAVEDGESDLGDLFDTPDQGEDNHLEAAYEDRFYSDYD